MAKAVMPKTALLGSPSTGPGGGGTPISRTVVKGSDNRKPPSKTASTSRTPTGGNW